MIVEHTKEADAFAIAMIAVMACAFGVIALIAFTIFRNARKRNQEVADLLEEVSREETKPRVTSKIEKKAEPWERDGDWWKK